MTVDEKDFLLKDYEVKIRYLSDHFQRMWTRLNFFSSQIYVMKGIGL